MCPRSARFDNQNAELRVAGTGKSFRKLLSTSLVDRVAAKNVFLSVKHGVSTSQSVTAMTKLVEN